MSSGADKEVALECGCRRGGQGASLGILRQVQRLYEQKMEHIARTNAGNKLQLEAETYRAWVCDLASQNALLARAVEELELAATTRVLLDRARHQEMVSELKSEVSALRRRLKRKDSDVRGLLELLRRLREPDHCSLSGIHFFEVTEADIFGSVEWKNKTLEEGDAR